jgi:hypothetical protein
VRVCVHAHKNANQRERPISHATVLTALGIDPGNFMTSPIGRTVKLSEGIPIQALLG